MGIMEKKMETRILGLGFDNTISYNPIIVLSLFFSSTPK